MCVCVCVCVCVFAMHGCSNKAVETKLGMVIRGIMAEVTGGSKAATHVAHIGSQPCHSQRVDACRWHKLQKAHAFFFLERERRKNSIIISMRRTGNSASLI